MHRPFDEPMRPHPASEPPGPWYGGGQPDPAKVDPAVLGALLDRHGWRRRGGAAGRYTRWTPPPPAGGGTSLLVPDSRAFPDSEDLLGEALTALARSAAPSARDVLVGLTVPSDEIRWWRDVPPGPSGTASWPAQEQLRSAARQMLLAGALAVRGRAGYYGARHRRTAQASLEGILVGPAPGGRSLTAFVPVQSGRAVAVRLSHALQATREAIDFQRAAGGMEAFDAGVQAGVSRELTEAVIALVRGSEGASIALEWSPAAGVPHGCTARMEPVEFSPAICPHCARRAPVTSRTSRPYPYGSPARSSACAARGRVAPGPCGFGSWAAPRCPTYGWRSTRRRTAPQATPTWWVCRSGWWDGWRAAAASGA